MAIFTSDGDNHQSFPSLFESVFTGLNNLKIISILSEEYEGYTEVICYGIGFLKKQARVKKQIKRFEWHG